MAAQCRSFLGEVKKELECCVCQEQFDETKEPKILKCLHTFCKSCLERWLRQHGGGQLSCPTCRQITECPNNCISSLPSNLFYKQMVDIVEAYGGEGQEDSPKCGSCEERKPLKFYCSHCNCFLCEDCFMAHRKLKIFKSHHVKEIENFMSSDAQDYARKRNVCKEHKDEVRFYCEQCVTCICRDCAVLEHRDHNFVSIDKGLERKKTEIETKMENVLANSSRLRDEKEFLEVQRIRMNKSIEKAKDEVHRVAERNIALIRQHESSVTEQLIKQKDVFAAEFSNAEVRMDQKQTEIERGLEFCNNLLQRSNLPEILNVEEVLWQRFKELSKPSDVNMNLNYSEFKYVPNDFTSLNESLGELLTTKTVPSLSEAEGRGLTEGTQGEDCAFKVITKDLQGKNSYSEIDEVVVHIEPAQRGTSLKVNITDSKDGCYEVTYKPETVGYFTVFVNVAGEAIKNSPFLLKVRKQTPRLKNEKSIASAGTGRITTAPTTMAEMTDHSESVLTESRLGRLSVEELARTVVISNIPRQITKDEIHIHFQKWKNGGGEVDDIWMTKNGQAVIVFEGPGVADRIFERTHVLRGKVVDVRPSHTQKQVKEDYQEIVEASTYEVQPNFAKLLRRVHKEKLEQIERHSNSSAPKTEKREREKQLALKTSPNTTNVSASNRAEAPNYVPLLAAGTNQGPEEKELMVSASEASTVEKDEGRDQSQESQTTLRCSICRNSYQELVEPRNCGHMFCQSCIDNTTDGSICSNQWCVCERSQPIGTMTWRTEKQSLPGYEDYYTIAVTYNFPQGTQGWEHPTPGHPYHGRFFTAYLPSNPEGRKICELLKRAFDARLLFRIGKGQATGEENQIVCNGIKHKINRAGGAAYHGYPDPTYLDRVKKKLVKIGIVEDTDSQV